MLRLLLSISIFCVLFVFCGLFPAYGQVVSPKLSIVSPEEGQVVNGRVELKFSVENFTLTARPEKVENSGVIALYLDGKFYSNVATSSASVIFPRTGTHIIDAELVQSTREPVIPRVSDGIMLYNQKKTPHLLISNIRSGSIIYTEQPNLNVELSGQEYVDQNSYYQVFVDGEVDGDSTQIVSGKVYTLRKPLTPGKHRLRVALYREDGKPYTPVVDSIIDVTYVKASPAITSIVLPEQVLPGQEVAFNAEVADFKIPENGRFYARSGLQEWSFASSSGILKGLPAGEQNITFSLVDLNGVALMPTVSAEKSIKVEDPNLSSKTKDLPQVPGIFLTGGNGAGPNWLLVSLAIVQAGVILLFGVILMSKHRKH